MSKTVRARFLSTVNLLLFRGDEILLLRRAHTGFHDSEYSIPAGHLDGGETVLAAAAREGREEIGVQIEPGALIFSSVMHRHEGDEGVDFFLQVKSWQGEPFNAEPEKCDDLRWAALSHLPVNLVPYIRQGISNHLHGVHFDEFGWEMRD